MPYLITPEGATPWMPAVICHELAGRTLAVLGTQNSVGSASREGARRWMDCDMWVQERRAVPGGNVRCETDPATGIEIHTYGSHIFHTKNEKVWELVNRFTKFNNYRHCVHAKHAGKIYHLPFGRTLYDEFFGKGNYELPPNDRQNAAIFDAFIRHYTAKQWGMDAEKVDPSVIKRLKVRDSYSTDYFDDPHQGIPLEGYNRLFDNMLDHPNITIQCKCLLSLEGDKAKAKGEGEQWINQAIRQSDNQTIYYSGPIDELFNYKFGALPWRSLRFEMEKLPTGDFQHNSVVNYPDKEVPYTRIHEFRHYHPEWETESKAKGEGLRRRGGEKTVIMREYSKTWEMGDEPYYPINNPESAALLKRYQDEAAKIPNLVVGGRLGGYKYYDMDQAMAVALEVNI